MPDEAKKGFAVGKMLLTCKKIGKQVPGALVRAALHLLGIQKPGNHSGK